MKLKKESIISSKLKIRVEIKSKMYQRRAHRSAGEEKCLQVLSRIYPHYKFETYRPNFLLRRRIRRRVEILNSICIMIDLSLRLSLMEDNTINIRPSFRPRTSLKNRRDGMN